jgi:hypothetical protein
MTAADAWITAFRTRDFGPAAAVLADDVAFRSPVLARPWRGRAVLEQLGPAMVRVFGDATFTARAEAGSTAFLLFEGRVAELDAEGVLVLETDDDDRVAGMAILIRPLTALMAVAERMGAAVDPELLAGH